MPREYGAWLDEHGALLRPGLVAVELGSGVGEDARTLTDAGLRVVGLDRDHARLGRAARRAPAAGFVVADLRAGLPFAPGVADIVVASLSLHYFDHAATDAILRDIARVAQPGGLLLARVNRVGDVTSSYGVGVEREPGYFEVEPGRFKRFFDEDTLADALRPCFDVLALYPRTTLVNGRSEKRTLVVRARRREDA